MTHMSSLGKRFLDNVNIEVRLAVRSRSPKNICDRIRCVRILLKLALEEYQKELDDDTVKNTTA